MYRLLKNVCSPLGLYSRPILFLDLTWPKVSKLLQTKEGTLFFRAELQTRRMEQLTIAPCVATRLRQVSRLNITNLFAVAVFVIYIKYFF
jgi:hypothetical protein